ncbi:MAG: hypothetical protein HF312_17585 [Ignavibacteria bacterium]|jgi:hypothetical protein|nr:hypothetical protein [Ignavibacteria bacterium]
MKSKYTFSLFCVLFFIVPNAAFPQGSVKISEVMFYGLSGNNEYVEIFNSDYDKAVDLTGFAVKYYTSRPDTIISSGMGLALKPRSYAVIFEGDYDISSGVYHGLVPEGALLLKIKSGSFGSSGMSNTANRNVSILNSKSDTLDTYSYSADNKAGISDEKIIPDEGNAPSNWANSLLQGGTPGYRNSVTPRDFDLSLSAIKLSPLYPKQDEAISLSLTVKNFGIKNAEDFQVEAFLETDMDSAATEKVYSDRVSILAAKDSAILTFRLAGLPGGSCRITGMVNFPKDEIPVNNKRTLNFSVSPIAGRYNDLVINEIMFAPSTGEPEWIELFNPSNSTVNLKNWKVSDRVTQSYIIRKNFLLKAGSFVVLSRDSTLRNYYDIPSEIIKCSLPQLNNDGDMIVLSDSTGLIIDSLEFKAPYGTGRSLERVDPSGPSVEASNWKISVSPFKATPGKPNSVRRLDRDLELREVILRPGNPFSGSRIALTAKVMNTGRNPMDFRLQLFLGRSDSLQKEEKLSESGALHLNPEDSLVFQFGYSEILLNERIFVVRILTDNDENPANNELVKQALPSYPFNTIAVNEIMYMPESPEPEWIEIYNTSLDSVNLKGWSVCDVYAAPSSIILSRKDEFIQPGCFMVLSRDSLIHTFHKNIPSKIIYPALPPFNNDKDGVIIKDAKGTVIDSAAYITPAGAKAGYSLERKEINKPSASIDNWSFSRSPEKSTPGKVNSVTRKEYDLALEEISTGPKEPLSGDNVSISVSISNPGLKEAENFQVKLYSRSYNSGVYNSIAAAEVPSLESSDTITLNFENLLQGLKRGMYVSALISYDMDKDTTNNYLQRLIEPGYGRNALLINEVMFAPHSGESEWLELVNVSSDTLDLKGWKVCQFIPQFSEAGITAECAPVYPGEFIIIAKDSSLLKSHESTGKSIFITRFGSLNNTGDVIVIRDLKGKVIDSLKYMGSWCDRKYSSIERISFTEDTCDSTNWIVSSGLGGGTPGKTNSAIGLHSYQRNSAVINEIMYEPGKSNSEFIEICNTSGEEIDLANWKIINNEGASFYLTDGSFRLSKGGYFVIASDSMVFRNYKWLQDSAHYTIKNLTSLGLTNQGGRILLKDGFKNTVDSVYYLSSWHSKTVEATRDRSLERINPLLSSNDPCNWRTCVAKEGATPGRLNSIFVLNQKAEARFSILPNPFSPDNDGFEDFTIINYNLSEGVTGVVVKIFDSQGRLVRTITPAGYGSKGSFVFDGMGEDGSPLRMGIYIVLLQALDSSNIVADTIKSVVVVARKL